MTVYDLGSIDLEATNSSHVLVIDLVGPDQRVLDIGCSTGYLGKELVRRGCTVDGVELDPAAAEIARTHLRRVVELNLDGGDIAGAFSGETYDRIILADVLEHLRDPESVLAAAATLLAPGGRIIISVPNVAHGSVRLSLMQGRWEYNETGLLDRTHIRFFTAKTIVELIKGAGLFVTHFRSTTLDPLASEIELDREHLPEPLVGWVRSQQGSFDYQYVLAAEVGPDIPVPPLIPAAVIGGMEEVDDGSSLKDVGELLAERAVLRRKILTLRDHAVGAEAELGQARRDRERAERLYEQAMHDVTVLRASASWRIGQVIVSPLKRVRGLVRGRS